MIPEYDRVLRYWRKDNPKDQGFLEDGTPVIYNHFGLNEEKTPEELGHRVGDILQLYSEFPTDLGPFKVKDLVGTQEKATFKVCYYVSHRLPANQY